VNTGSGGFCSCGFTNIYRFPCEHLVHVLMNSGIDVSGYVCSSWLKDSYTMAYAEFEVENSLTIREELSISDMMPPLLPKRRGRPKKRRIESQQATQELDVPVKRRNKCGKCGQVGHTRRSCTHVE
jgi:hypothetical protein